MMLWGRTGTNPTWFDLNIGRMRCMSVGSTLFMLGRPFDVWFDPSKGQTNFPFDPNAAETHKTHQISSKQSENITKHHKSQQLILSNISP